MPELKVPEGDSLPTACLTCALYGSNPGFESVRRVTLDFGVRPPKICTTSIRHLPTRIFFHHQGWLQLQCPLDSITFQWNQWVIGYNSERQFALLSRFGMASLSAQATNMLAALIILIGLIALYMLRHLLQRKPDKTQTAWLALCRKLAKAGLERAAHEGPNDYATRISHARPDLACEMQAIAARYLNLRYAGIQNEKSQQEFIQLVAKFRTDKR